MSQNGSARRSGITQSVAESVPSRDEIAKNIPPTIAPMSTYRQAGMSKLTSSHPSGAASALIRRSFSRRDRLVMGSVSSRSPTFDRLRVVGASSYGAARGAALVPRLAPPPYRHHPTRRGPRPPAPPIGDLRSRPGTATAHRLLPRERDAARSRMHLVGVRARDRAAHEQPPVARVRRARPAGRSARQPAGWCRQHPCGGRRSR